MKSKERVCVPEVIHVPYGQTVHGEEEIAAVVHVLKTSTQMGKHVNQMEHAVSALFDKRWGVMVNSGSSANYLAVEIADLPEGSAVITPALTFSTTIAPLIKHKLIPTLIDVAPGEYNIDVEQITRHISQHTKAMMIPNLLGNLPDWSKLKAIAEQYGLLLIEDSADTIGATLDGLAAGRFSDISTTSFYGSHVINCAGNGGMLCVNDDQFMTRAKLLRSWGRRSALYVDSEAIENRFNISIDDIPYDAKFIFDAIGYNLEPSEMGAAFGLVQLKKLAENIQLRKKWFNCHQAFFMCYQDYFILPKQAENVDTAWLAYPLTIRKEAPFSRTALQIFLEKRGIQTRTIFSGNILRQPGFKHSIPNADLNAYPETDQVMRGGFLIACHHGLSIRQVQHIHHVISEFLADYAL